MADFDISGSVPTRLTSLQLAIGNVMQCPVQEPTSGDFYVSQATSAGASGGNESVIISRVSKNGAYQDSMTLTNGGHGSTVGVERSGGKTFLWLTWQEAVAGGDRNGLVRFEYRAGATLTRSQTTYFTMLPKFGAGDRYVLMALDWPNGYVAYRDLSGTTETWTRRKIADVLAGVDKSYGSFTTSTATRTYQSHATLGDYLYVYTGTSDVNGGARKVSTYSWTSGRSVAVTDTMDMGRSTDGTFDGNFAEPEGCSVYRNASGDYVLLVGLTTGTTGNRSWSLFTFGPPASTSGTPSTSTTPVYHVKEAAPPLVGSEWNYFATRLNGDGTETILARDIPLTGVSITHTLSGHNSLTGNVEPRIAALTDSDGLPIFDPGSTAIYAEAGGAIRAGVMLETITPGATSLSLTGIGFTGYSVNMPYDDSKFFVKADPLDLVREIWKHIQGHPNGNLGLVLDGTKSTVKIGTTLKQGQFDTVNGPLTFEQGPYKLTWYQTADLSKEVADLAKSTPFDFFEEHSWASDPDESAEIKHRLRLGFPRLGRRRTDLAFIIGDNVMVRPDVEYGSGQDDFASEIMTLGAGEGAAMIRGYAARTTTRLRRVTVVKDTTLRSKSVADKRAQSELNLRLGLGDVTQLSVRDHANARVGSWAMGDEILLQGDGGWAGDINLWVRVVGQTLSPDNMSVATLTVVRTDKVDS